MAPASFPAQHTGAPASTFEPRSTAAPQDGIASAFEKFRTRVGKAATQTKKVFEPKQYAPMFRPSLHLLGGAGVIAGSSMGFAAAVAKPLVRMSAENPGATNLFSSVPMMGSFINELIGKAGALGALSIAAPLLGLVLTCVQSQGQASDRMHWFITHAALGLSMSPVWLLPVASAVGLLPAVALSAACMVGISVILSERVDKKQASVQMLFVGAVLVFSGAPLPALLATGATLGAVFTTAAVTLAGGAVLLAGVTLFNNFAALSDDSTAELRACATKSDLSDWRLNLSTEKDPTVICANPQLINHVQFLKNQLAAGKRLHVRTMLLSGPPGTGKTAISRSMGHALGAKTYLISPSKIMASENPAQSVRNLFAQAKTLGGRAIFFFDDAEVLFGDRKSIRKLDGGFDALTLMTTTLNDCLDGIERDAYEMLLVVLSTNNKSYLDDSIKQRFARCDVEILPPDREFFAEQLKTCFRRAVEGQFGRDVRGVGALSAQERKALTVVPPEVLQFAMAAFDAEKQHSQPVTMVGREMVTLCDIMLEDLNVQQEVRLGAKPAAAQIFVAFERSWRRVVRETRVREYGAASSEQA